MQVAMLGAPKEPMNRRTAIQLVETLSHEQQRAMQAMRIPGHPKPYFISYLLRHEEEQRYEAKYGALTLESHEARRNCLCDVRVGSYRNDQVRGGGLKDNSTETESYDMLRLPVAGHIDGLRHALWRLTESKYREAIDDLLHKKAMELSYMDEHRELPSFQREEAVEDIAFRALPAVDAGEYASFVQKASAVMRRYPMLRDGAVRFSAINTYRFFVSTEGTTIVQCMPFRTIEIYAWYLSRDGLGFPHTHSYFVAKPSELPSLDEVRAKIREIHGRLEELSKAPMVRSFSGPVLLDPRPAGLLMHEALGHRLEGNRLLSSGEGQTFRDAVGSMILPQGMTVRDDPRMTHFDGRTLTGHYCYDDEGTPAQSADLIVDGVLQGFLTSRTPLGKRHRSNGHARSAYHARPISRMGVTVVEAENGLEDDALFEAFLEEIRRQKVPYGIRIIDAYGGETSTDSYNFQAFLGEIDVAARVYPDGRQELIRGVDFVGTPLNAIRGIIAAGKRREADNAYCGAESGYVPVSTISPALLVEELELQQKPSRVLTQYAYPMPWE